PRDLSSEDPISFELLHLPDSRDVFLMQYNHAFLDNIAASHLLKPIDACFRSVTAAIGGSAVDDPVPFVQPDALNDFLARIPRWERIRAAAGTAGVRLTKINGASVQVAGAAPTPSTTIGIITRQLDEESTSRLKRWALERYHFPSISMNLLASLFR